jgi:hypothetical protein
MKMEDQYHRFVRWSEVDQCYIGYCPDLYLGGVCHHESEETCYAELCAIVRDEVAHRSSESTPLPTPKVRITRDLDFAVA